MPGFSDYPFKRVPDKAPATAGIKVSEEELKKFAGKYILKDTPVELTIEIVGGSLKANIPGQPVYTLVPVAANRFSIQEAPAGFFVEFEMAENKVKTVTFIQGPGQSLVLCRSPNGFHASVG